MKTFVSAAVIREGKLLLVQNGKDWMLPGGEFYDRGTDIESLVENVGSQIEGTLKVRLPYRIFRGVTTKRKRDVNLKVYLAELEDSIRSVNGTEIAFVNDFSGYNLTDTTKQAVDSLRRDGYL